MGLIGAIDVGSNGIRMAIAAPDGKQGLAMVDTSRAALRLGAEVFNSGEISDKTLRRSLEAFREFRDKLEQLGVSRYRAVATSALREAANRKTFVERIADETGIRLSIIRAEEEARLVLLAVSRKIKLAHKRALLIDIGGGSVEVSVVIDGDLIATESFRLGAVRLLEQFGESPSDEVAELISESAYATRGRLKREIGSKRVDLCIATGGNCETFGDLNKLLFNRSPDVVSVTSIKKMLHKLQDFSIEKRIERLGLRPDRADVIVPAAIVMHQFLRHTDVNRILIPRVGIREGVLEDLSEEPNSRGELSRKRMVLASAVQIGRKCRFDEAHAFQSAKLAVRLFDACSELHGQDGEARLMLETAALLHDIGYFVAASAHHKHSQYIICEAALVGLDQRQLAIVANVARYHRKAMPSLEHDRYRALSQSDRETVAQLSALLRIADSLDMEHAQRVTGLNVSIVKGAVTLKLQGRGELLLERWAAKKKSGMFERVFERKLVVDA